MGNCNRPTSDKQSSCPLETKDNDLNQAGQLQNFKKTLALEDKKKQLKWDQIFSAKASQRDNPSSSSSQRNIAALPDINQPLANSKSMNGQNSNSVNGQKENAADPAFKDELAAKHTAKQLSYQLTKENIQNYYQNPSSFQNPLSFQRLVIEDQDQQLPRPEAKIYKKKIKKAKQPEKDVLQTQSVLQTLSEEKAKLSQIQPQVAAQIQPQVAAYVRQQVAAQPALAVPNSQPSIIACLEREQKFEGMFAQGSLCSRKQLRVSTSNIEFQLAKVRAGPLIVSQLDYNYYAV